MLVRYCAVDRMILAIAMSVFAMFVVAVFTVLNRTGERIWRMFLVKRMLRAVHECNVALVGQYKAQSHTKHDGHAKNRTVPREG